MTDKNGSEMMTTSLHPGGHELTMHAAKAAGMTSGDKVLDIGCGNASSLVMLHDSLGIIPCGVDISEKAVNSAREKYKETLPDLELIQADACSLPFTDDSFDHVMMECVITLLPDPEAALHEAIRVLKPGGSLIISTLSTHTSIEEIDKNSDENTDRLICPYELITYMEARGFSTVLSKDRKADLTQYMIDSIMEYGSLEERIRIETEATGSTVFDCDTEYDRKTTSYHLFVFRKETLIAKGNNYLPCKQEQIAQTPNNELSTNNVFGTPVDALVSERIGVDPADLTQEVVEDYQLEAFRRTMRHAMEHGRFYREHFAGLDPDEIRTMEDIRRIPATSEADLAGNEWQFQCMPSSDIDRTVTVPVLEKEAHISCSIDPAHPASNAVSSSGSRGSAQAAHTVTLPTSGTSGKSKRIVFTAEDQERSIAFINRGFMTQRCTKGERMLVFMSGTTEGSIGDLVMRAMAPLEMDIRVYGAVTDIADAYNALMEFRPGVVEALPWHAAALARYGTRFGNPEKDFIRSVNLSADVVPDSIVHRLEVLWECTVHRHYGTTEMAIFGGVECEYHQGYHTRPCDILYEIPETDESGYGEMLITTLDRKAMPLIRYRTGDIARFIDTPCPCGCRIRRIERFLGRRSSLIEFADNSLNQTEHTTGSFYLSELADALYRIPEVIDFDVTVREGSNATLPEGSNTYLHQDYASSCTPELELTIRTLPGDHIDTDAVRSCLMPLLGDRAGLYESTGSIIIDIEDTDSFPGGYNLKKKVIRL